MSPSSCQAFFLPKYLCSLRYFFDSSYRLPGLVRITLSSPNCAVTKGFGAFREIHPIGPRIAKSHKVDFFQMRKWPNARQISSRLVSTMFVQFTDDICAVRFAEHSNGSVC